MGNKAKREIEGDFQFGGQSSGLVEWPLAELRTAEGKAGVLMQGQRRGSVDLDCPLPWQTRTAPVECSSS